MLPEARIYDPTPNSILQRLLIRAERLRVDCTQPVDPACIRGTPCTTFVAALAPFGQYSNQVLRQIWGSSIHGSFWTNNAIQLHNACMARDTIHHAFSHGHGAPNHSYDLMTCEYGTTTHSTKQVESLALKLFHSGTLLSAMKWRLSPS